MTAIRIGNKIGADSYEGLADAIVQVFQSAAENHVDEQTTRQALQLLRDFASHPTTITNSTFTSGCCG